VKSLEPFLWLVGFEVYPSLSLRRDEVFSLLRVLQLFFKDSESAVRFLSVVFIRALGFLQDDFLIFSRLLPFF